MDVSKVREYAELMRELDLTALEVKWTSEGEQSMRMERNLTNSIPIMESAGTKEASAQKAVVSEAAEKALEQDKSQITSPMVGVFYVAPAENADPFVQVGSRVKAGDVVCIIEAMKLMNEIVAGQDGVITEILATNGAIVEFGQPLFRIREA